MPNQPNCGTKSSGKKVNLVPIKTATQEARQRKVQEIHEYYKVKDKLAFVHVFLLDNRSDFLAPLNVEVRQGKWELRGKRFRSDRHRQHHRVYQRATGPDRDLPGIDASIPLFRPCGFSCFGEGETGMLVYTILLRYWESTPEHDVMPYIFLMSEGVSRRRTSVRVDTRCSRNIENLQRLFQRLQRVRSGEYSCEMKPWNPVSAIALRNSFVIHLLRVVHLVTSGVAGGVEMPDVLDVVPHHADDVAFHDLHVIHVVENLHARRVHSLAHLHPIRHVVEIVVLVVDLAVQVLDCRW